ncbi:MAG: DNA recombination/repair protein RecA, partial [Acidobacteriia bacterium]|nr:DNA recombination/repair protein RecA [Terriglobia bacterium]
GQGRENSRNFLRDNADIYAKLDKEVRARLGLLRGEAASASAPAPDVISLKAAPAGKSR